MEQNALGNNNIQIANVDNSTITINSFLNKSADYQELLEKKEAAFEDLQYIDVNAIEHRKKKLLEFEEIIKQIKQFEQDVINLAKQFLQVNIDTKRYLTAKAYFEQGDFASARNALNETELDNELNLLTKQKEVNTEQGIEISKKLEQLSDEYLLKASLILIDIQNPSYLQEAEAIYKKALSVFKSYKTLVALAKFYSSCQQLEHAIVYYKQALDYGKNNIDSQIVTNYDIGTCYLKFEGVEKLKAKEYLEEAVNLTKDNLFDHYYIYTILGNALHNLSSVYPQEDTDAKIKILKQAVSIREKAALLDGKTNSLLAYTLGNLLIQYFRIRDVKAFEETYERAVRAMEQFSESDLNNKLDFFQETCLLSIIQGLLLFNYLTELKSKIPHYLRRIELLLLPFENYILKNHKEKVYHIAVAYEEFAKYYFDSKHIYSERNINFYKKCLQYYKEALMHQMPNDDIYAGLGLSLFLLACNEIMGGDKKIAKSLLTEAKDNFDKVTHLTEKQEKTKNMIEYQIVLECNCQDCS